MIVELQNYDRPVFVRAESVSAVHCHEEPAKAQTATVVYVGGSKIIVRGNYKDVAEKLGMTPKETTGKPGAMNPKSSKAAADEVAI